LQHLEKSTIKHLIDARILSFYTRYVDDIFLIYDSTGTSSDNILQYIDTIHGSFRLNPTLESDNNGNSLDVSITQKPTSLRISIFHKSTTTDTTINFLSNHLLEHKMAAYQFLIRRMISLPLDREQQYKEWQHIARSCDIPLALLIRLRLRMQQNISLPKSPTLTTSNHGMKWATFMYPSPQVRKITNIFKHTNIRIAFKCSNTLLKLSRPDNKTILPPTPYDKCDIYMLTCMTSNGAYVSQTSRSLKLRYKENTCYIKSNNLLSAYALHILNNQHEYSPI